MSKRRHYYPQYYRAKRRRERTVLVISTLIVVVVAIAGVIFLGFYLSRLFSHPSTLEEIVAQKEELAAPPTEQPPPVKTELPTGVAAAKPQPKLIALEDISEYAESVPEISIIPQGLGTPTPEEAAPPAPEEEQTAAEPEAPAEATPEPGTPPSTEPRQPEPKAKPKPAATPAKAAAEKPESRPAEAKKPAKEKPARTAPRYLFTVFAGVYEEDRVANREMARLRELGFKPHKLTRAQGGVKNYLVSVGEPLAEYELAEAVKKKLQEAGFSDAYILRKSTD